MNTLDTNDLNSPTRPTDEQIDKMTTVSIPSITNLSIKTASILTPPQSTQPDKHGDSDSLKETASAPLNQVGKLDEILETMVLDIFVAVRVGDVVTNKSLYGYKKAKQALLTHFLEIIEGAKPEPMTELNLSGGSRSVEIQEMMFEAHKCGVDDYHTNLVNKVNGGAK